MLGLTHQWNGARVTTDTIGVQRSGVGFLGREDSLEKEMATHSSILAWEIP